MNYEKLYGKKIEAKEIVMDCAVKAPPSASTLISTLDKASPVERTQLQRLDFFQKKIRNRCDLRQTDGHGETDNDEKAGSVLRV